MADVVITRNENGHVCGLGEKGVRAWDRFCAAIRALSVGDTLSFSWEKPRSPAHHRLFFAKLNALADRQEQFADADTLRQWLTVGAGYADFVPGPKGRMVAMPKSIKWTRMEENEFQELHAAVDGFLWTDHARRFLWPHLSDEQTYEAISRLMDEFAK